MQNLIDNAVKYGQFAKVRINSQASGFVISIQDQGPGIPEQYLDTVFQPFYRLEKSRNSATGGVGLGLSVAMNIFSAHGGTLSLVNLTPAGLSAEIKFDNNMIDS